MADNQANTIYPCPFSKGYGIPVEQAWSSLKIFFIYRFTVSSLFLIIFYSHFNFSLSGLLNSSLYNYSSLFYWFISFLSGICIFTRKFGYVSQAQLIIFTDIIFIPLLMHASGGINSGVGILLIIPIATSGLLIGGQCALLFAALASLSILAEQFYTLNVSPLTQTSFTYAGTLGASFFTSAYLSYIMAKRTEQSQLLASQHQQTISNLEELNQYIIQHLQSGIIISNSLQQIKMCNETALKIIRTTDDLTQPKLLQEISPILSDCFKLWLTDNSQDFALIQLPNKNEIHLRFSLLKTIEETFHMLILDDISLYNQRLQLSKLASLGRLTASIAHEIRNPLGAISHAGQLLSETPSLSPQDLRLTEIIQAHCNRVNKIIEDVLQLSRRQPSKKEKINLNQWIQSYLENHLHDACISATRFKIISPNTELWIYMDSGHLKQIIDNLCSNALKYGNITTEPIFIELSELKNIPCISILNNGTQLDPEAIKQLFEPFFTTSPTGTGLGLYISKELAELNQAKLSYSIRKNKNCFTLALPCATQSKIEI